MESFKKIILCLIFIAALVHMTLSAVIENSGDLVFTICLIANTLLMINVLTIAKRIMDGKKELYDIKSIFRFKEMLVLGVIYGSLFGFTPFVIPFKTSEIAIKISAAALLGLHNFLTGMCISPLVRFFVQLFQDQKQCQVKLWDRSNPELKTHLKIYDTLIIHVTTICSLAITAAFISFFSLGDYAWIFSSLCALFMLSAYLLPQYPIIKSLKDQKRKMIEDINGLIQKEFDSQVGNIAKGEGAEIKRLENLKFLRSIVAGTSLHFSTVEKRTKGIVSVAFISAIPTVLKCLFEHFIKTQL